MMVNNDVLKYLVSKLTLNVHLNTRHCTECRHSIKVWTVSGPWANAGNFIILPPPHTWRLLGKLTTFIN